MIKYVPYYLPRLDLQLTNPGRCVAFDENARAFARFFFHPRVMRPVSHCDPSTTILGYKSSIPVFISGAALAKLGHPEGGSEFFGLAGRAERTLSRRD